MEAWLQSRPLFTGVLCCLFALHGCALRTSGTLSSDTSAEGDQPGPDTDAHADTGDDETAAVDGDDDTTQDDPPDDPAGDTAEDPVAEPDAEPECVDNDGDGYGDHCENGPDCDDTVIHCTTDCEDSNSNGFADCAETTWLRSFEYESHRDNGRAVVATPGDGVSIGGATYGDFWVVRLDRRGELNWNLRLAGSISNWIWSVIMTPDLQYVVTGYTNSFGAGNDDFWIVKLDDAGSVIWQKTLGGSESESAESLCMSADYGYVLAGWTTTYGIGLAPDENVWVVKLDPAGEVQWQKSIGTESDEQAFAIVKSPDHGFVIAGRIEQGLNDDMLVMKLDEAGEILWQKAMGGDDDDEARAIIASSDGGYIVAGLTDRILQSDMVVLKLDESGDVLWQKAVDTGDDESARSIIESRDNGYVIAGVLDDPEMGMNMYLVKLEADGEIVWQKSVGGGQEDEAFGVTETGSTDIVAVGRTRSFRGADNDDMMAVRLLGDGRFMGECAYVTDASGTVRDFPVSVDDLSMTSADTAGVDQATSSTPREPALAVQEPCPE